MITKLNGFAEEVHRNAVEKGFYENEPEMETVLALIHSELSEALEEYRNDMPMIWFRCDASEEEEDFVCNDDRSPCKNGFVTEGETRPCIYKNAKPEGIAVELADAVIRILDTSAQMNVDIDGAICDNELLREEYFSPLKYKFPKFINELHNIVSMASEAVLLGRIIPETFVITSMFSHLAYSILLICRWMEDNGINFEETMRMKHEYNKTRPFRHGGKKV